MEGKVLFDILDVGVGNKTRSAESAFALAALALKQVAFSLVTTEYLPGASDFEALGMGRESYGNRASWQDKSGAKIVGLENWAAKTQGAGGLGCGSSCQQEGGRG